VRATRLARRDAPAISLPRVDGPGALTPDSRHAPESIRGAPDRTDLDSGKDLL